MMDFGCESWKTHLEVLVHLLNDAQKQVQVLKKEIQEINWQRKSMQTQGGEKLRALEAQWVGLVSKNYEIEQACVHLEEEILKGGNSDMSGIPTNHQEPAVPGQSATEVMAIEMRLQEERQV